MKPDLMDKAESVAECSIDELNTSGGFAVWAKANFILLNFSSASAGYAKALALDPHNVTLQEEYRSCLDWIAFLKKHMKFETY